MTIYLRHLKRSLRDLRLPVGAIFLFAGAALLWTTIEMALDLKQAVDLPATVLGKELIRADRENTPSTRYVLRYRFVEPGGEAVEAEEDVEPEVWEELATGDSYPVRYVPGKRKTIPADIAEPIGAAIVGVVSVVILLIGRWLAVPSARQLLTELRLLARGTPATATVTNVYPTSTAINRVPLWKLSYRYKDQIGAEHEAESGFLMPQEAQEWQPGSTGAIRYDPRRSGASVWLGQTAASDRS